MRALAAALIALTPVPVMAETVVLSGAPVSTSVTVYRDGNRDSGGFNLRWLQGYALISEKRRVTLPAGDSVVRFEGVADGMIAVSAVVSGLPGGVDEKNRDARLLSPASLLDGTLGKQVHVRRTSRQTGEVSETEAIVRSGPDNAVVLETPEGVEALRCSGLPETLVYDEVPDGLSAKPAFSVHTSTAQATEAEVTLTYLATGFDWGASYVAKVAEDGKTLDLFAWLTVANGNGSTYERTQLLAVAGKPNRTSDFRQLGGEWQSPYLRLECWPMGNTSTMPFQPPPAPPAPMMERDEIMVTAQKKMESLAGALVAVQARQEDLGDLKLYRVPMPVDVLPNAQKQVALLHKEKVPFEIFYRAYVDDYGDKESKPLYRALRMHNKAKDGLGLPLPSGGVIVTQLQGGEELLLGSGPVADKAVGEKVEIDAGESAQVRYSLSELEGADSYRIEVSNATDRRVSVEMVLTNIGADQKPVKADAKLVRKDGRWLWKADVRAKGTATLTYSIAKN